MVMSDFEMSFRQSSILFFFNEATGIETFLGFQKSEFSLDMRHREISEFEEYMSIFLP